MVKKVLILLIALVLVGAGVCFGMFIKSHPGDGKNENTTNTSVLSGNETESTDVNSTSYAPDVTESTVIPNKKSEEMLLGSWNDSANLSGYEFIEGGIVKVTYFNMSALNLENVIEGTYKGTYTVDGDKITISYTIYSEAIIKTYTFKVDDSFLTLINESGEESFYVRKGSSAEMKNVDKELLGSWKSNMSGFEFKENGIVTITYIDLSSLGIILPISGTADGVYEIDGDTLTLKYSIYSGVVKKVYTYKIDGKVLTLTEKGTNETGTYMKGN